MTLDPLYELTRRSIPLSKNDCMLYISWQDSVLCIRTDKGMQFLEFSYNLSCLEKDIDVLEFSIPCPKNSPATRLCESLFINSEMKNYDYTEMLIDSSFWPHNNSLNQEMASINMSLWSPEKFLDNRSVIAILNNIGGVEIYKQQHYRWESVINLSSHIQDCLEYNRSPIKFDELKQSVYIVETSAICWAPELNRDRSCYFVTAQKNGILLFWELYACSQPTIKVKIQCDILEIQNMIWIPITENQLWLICADILGQVYALDVHLKNGDFKLKQIHELWQYKDRMIVSHLNYIKSNENIVLFYSKYRHFVAQMLDQNCKIISEFVNNINDYRITDITYSLDGYYLTTINVKIYQLDISISGSTLCVNFLPVALKESYPSHELYSISFSNNNTIGVLGIIDRKLHSRKEVNKIDIIFVSTESKLNSLIHMFITNPSKKLTKYWDCIEAFRYKIMKSKLMPDIDFDSFYFQGTNDIYKLKVYLFFLIVFSNMKQLAWISTDFSLPEWSKDTVQEKIMLLQAQKNLENLYRKHEKHGKLDCLDEEALYGSLKYLQYYSKKHKTEVAIDENTYSVMKNHFKYSCQSCDDEVTENFTCKSGHLNMYCMLSFTPITSDDYLVCKCCNATARTDFVKEALCVFCDQLLIKLD